jgi:hypothetical protein
MTKHTSLVTIGCDLGDKKSSLCISQSDSKTDQVDAELLARLGKADVELLAPIQRRSTCRRS